MGKNGGQYFYQLNTKKTKIEPFRLYAVEEICRKKVKDNERETHCLFSVSVACIGYLTNSIFILPLLQLAVNSFSPPSFDAGKLQSPFLMLQEIEKSSQPPIIVPAMFPFFAVKSIVFPVLTRSHIMLPPFVSRPICRVNDKFKSVCRNDKKLDCALRNKT